jgi:hypothetical protein
MSDGLRGDGAIGGRKTPEESGFTFFSVGLELFTETNQKRCHPTALGRRNNDLFIVVFNLQLIIAIAFCLAQPLLVEAT